MEHRDVRITGVKPTTLAMFEGLFAALIGFAVSVAAWIGLTAHYTAATDSLLKGMLFGLAPGILAVIVDTIIYYAAGWIIGLVHGWLFNAVSSGMRGIVVGTQTLENEGPEVTDPRMASSRARRPEPTFGETVGNRRIDR
jgi:hypothetical protein